MASTARRTAAGSRSARWKTNSGGGFALRSIAPISRRWRSRRATRDRACARELETIFGAAPLAHWRERFAGVDCCVTPILTLDEALEDPQFTARGMVVRQPDGSRQYAPPFKMSGCEFAVAREAPAQGEHTVEVLRDAGYDDAAIAGLDRGGHDQGRTVSVGSAVACHCAVRHARRTICLAALV